MKKFSIITIVLVAVLALASCNKEKSIYLEDIKYLTVMLQGSDKWSIVDIESGAVVAKDLFQNAPSAVVDDMFYVYDTDGRINYYNVSDCSKPVNTTPYGSATTFAGGYAVASKPGEVLEVIDKQCNTVAKLSPSVLTATSFCNGRSLIHTDLDRYGYIDTKGDTVISPNLGYAASFNDEDVALVSFNDAADTTKVVSVIDLNGKKLFDIDDNKYQILTPYYGMGVLTVSKKDSVVYLDRNGKEVDNPLELPKKVKDANYRDGRYAGDGKYMVVKGDRMGLVDENNNILIPFEYQYINNVTSERFIVGKDSVMFIVDDHGKQVGNAKFIDFKQLQTDAVAQRGYINAEVIAANLLSFIDEDMACGARKGSTLMDLNGLVGVQAAPYVGLRQIDRMIPPMVYSYHFDRDIATTTTAASDSLSTDSTALAAGPSAQFDYNARVRGVSIRFSVIECAPGTEERLCELMSSSMGTKGFALNADGSFTSSAGTMVVMGYEKGIFALNYYFDPSEAKPLPRQSRSR